MPGHMVVHGFSTASQDSPSGLYACMCCAYSWLRRGGEGRGEGGGEGGGEGRVPREICEEGQKRREFKGGGGFLSSFLFCKLPQGHYPDAYYRGIQGLSSPSSRLKKLWFSQQQRA